MGKRLDDANSPVLSLYRMVISLLFVCHGSVTVLGLFDGTGGGRVSAGTWPGWWAGLIQLTGGVLVFIGIGDIGTRVAAVVSSGSMAYAYFTVHQKNALWPIQNGGELSVLFCWSFLLIAVVGPGTWTLARLLSKARAGGTPSPSPSAVPAAAAAAATAGAASAETP
ncbi:DoxX family protein [Streptomyces sp. SID4948]|uniref:DoxX family protein n=1 Tax=Streptomyces sp. SID4948 TaxID=2690287 RepID=UPI0031FDE606